MKLKDYRDAVWQVYPDSFMDSRVEWDFGDDLIYEIFLDSSRSAILGLGRTPLIAWKSVYNQIHNITEDED